LAPAECKAWQTFAREAIGSKLLPNQRDWCSKENGNLTTNPCGCGFCWEEEYYYYYTWDYGADGINCAMINGSMHITMISIGGDYGNMLEGVIPAAIGEFSYLEVLDLSNNKGLHGSIPTEIGKLDRLQHLHMSSSALSGTIPTVLGNLKSLVSVNMYDNSLTGEVPAQIATIPTLKQLILTHNQLSGRIPSLAAWENRTKKGEMHNCQLQCSDTSEQNRFDPVLPKSDECFFCMICSNQPSACQSGGACADEDYCSSAHARSTTPPDWRKRC
jgi:hypothetical protein